MKFTIKEKYIRLFGIPILTLLIPFIFGARDSYWESAFTGFWYTLIYWQGGWMIVQFMRKKYPRYEQTEKRILLQAVVVVVFITVITPACEFISQSPLTFANYMRSWMISVAVTFVVISIYESAFFFDRWKLTMLEAEQIKREHIQSQYETLKNQVNPHFLFNSFNTLTTIILENQELAVKFVERLADVYRYVLQNKDKELVTVETELEFARAYLFLHQIRFGDNLKYVFKVDKRYLDSSIAPLSLQILLENAIKHNIISHSKPLTIEIYVENNHIVVKNNLQKKVITEASTEIGLQNIVNRYKYLTDQTVNIIHSASNFMVALPLLKIEKSYA